MSSIPNRKMKYMSEYQRSYQRRTPSKFSEQSVEERKLSEAPRSRSAASPSRRPRPAQEPRRLRNENFALIGPHENLSESKLYRLRDPVPDRPRLAKSQEFAILGRNEKLQDNVIYPMRQPILSNSPRVVVRRRKTKHQSIGTQVELRQAPSASYAGREAPQRKPLQPQSEYRSQFDGKQPHQDLAYNSLALDNVRSSSAAAAAAPRPAEVRPSSPKKSSAGVNTPARVDIMVDERKPSAKPVKYTVKKPSGKKHEEISEPATRPRTAAAPKPKTQAKGRPTKAYEAEQIDERKSKEQPVDAERAQSDDEGAGRNVDLGRAFRERYPHGKLRRWKSEYQANYKPFWRFDYKDGKWYKDSSAEETGFNPDLYWYRELMSTRRRADEYRSKAEMDHFNPEHTLQLQTGYIGKNPYRAWDAEENEEVDSVISIDRDLERERIEGQQRREKDAQRKQEERSPPPKVKPAYHPPRRTEHSSPRKSDPVIPIEHEQDRVIYIDEPRAKPPSAATKAFVRNLSSTSVAQHMSWDSESLYTERTNSDLDYQSLAARHAYRKIYPDDNVSHSNRHSPKKKYESRGTGTHSHLPSERQSIHSYHSSPRKYERPASSHAETRPRAPLRPSYDTQPFDPRPVERPHTSMTDYPSYGGSRFKDEVTDYYYGSDHYSPSPYRTQPAPYSHYKNEDAPPEGSARSLSSSASLALQTLERAQQNREKYWDDRSPHSMSSPKKLLSNKY